MNKIPYDIPSYDPNKHIQSFYWPSNYSDYKFLSYGFIDGAVSILNNIQNNDLKIATTCKLSELIIDITNVVRQSIDLNNANDRYTYNRLYSPILDWLAHGGPKEDERILFRLNQDEKEKTLYEKVFWQLRRLKRAINYNNNFDYNAINYNILMQEWIDKKNVNTHNLLTESYICGTPHNDTNLFKDIINNLQNLIHDEYNFSTPIKNAVNTAVTKIVTYHLSQALGDLNKLKSSKLNKKLSKGLISGTPKYEGRMLGWYFMDNGKDVIRFAHGGERVFYEDYAWPIAELPYCTEYFAHSNKEASNMSNRILNNKYSHFDSMKSIQFKTVGSKKHQSMHEPNVTPTKEKTLVYVTSVYEHDSAPGLPNFKLPDVLYYDFQIRMLKYLKSQGWKIILKPHPKGLFVNDDYLALYVDEIIKTPFTPNNLKADCFLFDFAGTAFFDTLFTNQRVALLNLAERPIASAEYENLLLRASILNIHFETNGRVKMDGTLIENTINNAPDILNTRFIENYAS